MPVLKIVSGGQTGVDRGALDAALAAGVPCGGWCPAGRLAEDGVIPTSYPLTELAEAGYRQRTIRNVQDSDATLIIYFGILRGGTEQTLLHCARQHKPYKLVDGSEIAAPRGSELAADFVASLAKRRVVLNVAGPRQSQQSGALAYAFDLVSVMLRRFAV